MSVMAGGMDTPRVRRRRLAAPLTVWLSFLFIVAVIVLAVFGPLFTLSPTEQDLYAISAPPGVAASSRLLANSAAVEQCSPGPLSRT